MDGLHILVAVLIGVVSCSHNWIFTSTLDLTASHGDNITLYCDCKRSSNVYIVWYRNCSHENQPTLKTHSRDYRDFDKNFPRFKFVKNFSSDSYDLRIINVTDSDEGLYYCGTEQVKVEEKEHITSTSIYTYGNITTRVKIHMISESSNNKQPPKDDCDNKLCWILLFSLCPTSAVLFSLISVFIYHLCHKKGKDPQIDERRSSKREQTRKKQDEDVCYAALEIRQASQRPKKRKESSDFSTYSAINTCSM